MYKISNIIFEKNLPEFIAIYRNVDRVLPFCKECDRYNKSWSCPPFNFDTEDYISTFDKAYIIGTKIDFLKETIKENKGIDNCISFSNNIYKEVRQNIDEKLLEIEHKYAKSRAFFGGACVLCEGLCAKIKDEPCIFPDKIRPSLESLGFDVCKISSELLKTEIIWSKDGVLPEYYIIVSAIFTNNNINISAYIN